MALVPGGAGGAPALEMAVRAKDETEATFNKVRSNADRMGMAVARAAGSFGTLAMQAATFGRMTGLLSEEQARFLGIIGTVSHALSTTYYAAKAVATAVTWAHNAALTWELALMTAGVGVVIAAAAAMAVLSIQTQSAANAQRDYNQQLEAGVRGVSLQRRRDMIRRGEWEEAL